ncbi:patatin-like phospholipase family protein [Granulosicoccus sp. 3-233]|uniref:patatin-like phospholipase family protein n=1 Tax=Granulosicoccus sp. 3-233 TaxID=3417969 RepID=UPI003D341828
MDSETADMPPEPPSTALILGGGGARAAYQVGVLDAIRQVICQTRGSSCPLPFKVLCGTSAGAITATSLASHAASFDTAMTRLLQVWSDFQPNQVYRTDVGGALANASRWLSALSMGWLIKEPPRSLFDNRPLRQLLEQNIDFNSIDHAIARGHLEALAISTSSYSSGRHIVFYQSHHPITPWTRSRRLASRTTIGVDHLMASSAIPFVFPAARLQIDGKSGFFGDGAMRQNAPISPAIHLGATRIVVIGAGQIEENSGEDADTPPSPDADDQTDYPALGQIGGHVMASIFLDGMAADVERLERINRTLDIMTPEQQQQSGLKPLDLLTITPSKRLDSLAEPFVRNLPRTTRSALRVLGATGPRGVGLSSYLLFDKQYTQTLIALGRRDGLARSDEIAAFFEDRNPE